MFDQFLENGFWYSFFALLAISSTVMFMLRLAIAMIFGDSADSHDIAGDATGFDSDASFELLSIQSILAFFMAFGWMGLAGLQAKWGMSFTVSMGLLVGATMIGFNAALTLGVRRFDSVHVYDLKTTIGKVANTYLTIPANGRGKVEVVLSGAKQVLNARTVTGEDIPSFTPVTVVEVDTDGTLVVARLDRSPSKGIS